jgi:2-keto-4-pentenoate hydratase
LSRVCAELANFGLGLKADQRLITGSLLKPVVLDRPGRWAADFGKLGCVAVEVA